MLCLKPWYSTKSLCPWTSSFWNSLSLVSNYACGECEKCPWHDLIFTLGGTFREFKSAFLMAHSSLGLANELEKWLCAARSMLSKRSLICFQYSSMACCVQCSWGFGSGFADKNSVQAYFHSSSVHASGMDKSSCLTSLCSGADACCSSSSRVKQTVLWSEMASLSYLRCCTQFAAFVTA